MNDLSEYRDFVEAKTHLAGEFGFKPVYENPHCHDFQHHLNDWACRQGRAATFADCGLGKTLMQLVWAENVHRKTNKPVLILAPLSVSAQTVEEAEKFGIEAVRSQDGKFPAGKGIVCTNYERLHHFDADQFSGIVCDESSILKNFDGAIKATIIDLMRKVKYRAMYTATPSPNDYTELGNTSEALGDMAYMTMLETFFKSNDDTLHPAHIGQQWRFKGHAEPHFWRWVASWARAIRKPSDMGFKDDGWILPELIELHHEIESKPLDGQLFAMPVRGLPMEREERKATYRERCELAAKLLAGHDSGVAWCHLNAEADYMAEILPGAVNLSGADKDEVKEEKFAAFKSGQIKDFRWSSAMTGTSTPPYAISPRTRPGASNCGWNTSTARCVVATACLWMAANPPAGNGTSTPTTARASAAPDRWMCRCRCAWRPIRSRRR